jgi:phytanoyl-CoA hydroxylase
MKKLLILCFLFSSLHANITQFTAVKYLTKQMRHYFATHGFVVLKSFLTPAQCIQLKREARHIVDTFDPQIASIFSAQAEVRSNYFLDSADKVSCFLEEHAVQDGKLVMEKQKAVNKIGHALHDKNLVFKRVTFSDRIARYARDINIIDPLVVQSMFIFKSKMSGGAVPSHQDATFLYTDPVSVVGFWIALDDATQENACMWAIPGSHTWPLCQRYITDEVGNCSFKSLYDQDWPDDQFVPLEVEKGSLIIFKGTLVHKSEANLSNKDRNAYTFHVISGTTSYASDNWLQRSDMPHLVTEEK